MCYYLLAQENKGVAAVNKGTATVVKPVRMYPEDIETVDGVAESYGMTYSQAIRYIIRDWKRLKAQGSQDAPSLTADAVGKA